MYRAFNLSLLSGYRLRERKREREIWMYMKLNKSMHAVSLKTFAY